VFAVLGIAGVVLFPAVCGPFTATYGPASALRAMAYAVLLALALCTLTALDIEGSAFRLVRVSFLTGLREFSSPHTPILRC
jgi:hypothetical protein